MPTALLAEDKENLRATLEYNLCKAGVAAL
jgi:hypothetical protein